MRKNINLTEMLFNYLQVPSLQYRLLTCLLLVLAFGNRALAVEEPYMSELKGPQVKADSFFVVADEKYGNAAAWNQIYHSLPADDLISFEINFDTSIYFYNHPFKCTVNFTVYIYGNASDINQVTDSTTHRNISLDVRYDSTTGSPYKGIALYKFKGAHKYKVKINSITSAELSPILPIFRLKGQIFVNRKYNFVDVSTDISRYSLLNGNQLLLEWAPGTYQGAEQFDVEFTHIDDSSEIARSIRNYATGPNQYSVPVDSLEQWFRNNSTRVTTASSSYLLNVPYDKGFVLFRIRGVQIHYPDEVRWEGNWNYGAKPSSSSCTANCGSGVVAIGQHEAGLNWQYSVVFAEEGKRKEVMSYFDGSLHNRQSVTLNNSDNKTIVQETIYDNLGRPAVSVLPVPTPDNTIHYFPAFNQNSVGQPYSYADFVTDSCSSLADSMKNVSGASHYYSENNPFQQYYFSKYIPKAENYPFTVTEYVADNTGRIKAQGGVGPAFQINSGHETKYFYGKPNSQEELDRLFGNEAGKYNHYLKNMVVDPNGQISVSYVDAGGKTIATALAGATPPRLHPLSSSAGAMRQVSDDLFEREDFTRSTGDYSMTATTTFLAPVTGTYVLDYRVDPLRLDILYGAGKDSVICSDCSYDLEVVVKDNCNATIRREVRPAGTLFDTACLTKSPIQDTLSVLINRIGEYYVTYALKVSRDALNFYDSVHLVKNTDIRRFNSFLLDELKETDFYGCYSKCETCLEDLGTKADFVERFKALYVGDSVLFESADSLWVLSQYDSLLVHCQSIQGTCPQQSVCEEKLQLLKMDVSPGGQYALYDSSFHLLEPSINILGKRNQVLYFTDEYGNRDSVALFSVDGQDSVVAVKDLSDSLFIAHWNDAWADSLVRFHPEYCYYQWCVANSTSYAFDREIENWMDADTAVAKGWFNPADYKALLDKDPFFNTIGGVTGLGAGLYPKMMDSLRLFSRTVLRLSQADKNILQFADIVLYCKEQYNGWNSCQPDSSCRSRSREWFLYKQLYLNLKQRFYEEARRTNSNSIFANCTNCYVGRDLLKSLSPSLQCDSLQKIADDFKVLRTPVSNGQVAGNKKITSCGYEVVNAANAIIEARNTFPAPSISQDFCWDSNLISMDGELRAVKWYPGDTTFHAIVPLSLSCTQDIYPELRNTTVLPGDFCKGAATQAQLNDHYYAVTMKEEGNFFRLIWAEKNSSDYAYYGTSSPIDKYLPDTTCQNCENHVYKLGFIRMPNMSYTHQTYTQIRAQQPFIPFDSILRVRNLRFATEALPANYSTIADNDFSSYLKVTLDLIDGTSIDAHMISDYDGTIYVKYKQSLTDSIYDSNCQIAFASYFNQQKGTNYTFSQIDSLYRAVCGTLLTACLPTFTTPFSFEDSTCSNSCPDGVYTPYDRPGMSLYVEYGQPGIAPVQKPSANYSNCQFYSVFDLKTGSSSCCRFFNVWVCVYDSTGTTPTTYPSSCPDDSLAQRYKNKVRRYPEYVNTDEFINQTLSRNPQEESEASEQVALDQCASNCGAQAEIWINTLSRCTTDSAKRSQLKQALIEICSKGCSVDRPFGASSIPSTIPATYHSFEEAIVGIVGPGAINDSCTAELLSEPYPYDRQPLYTDRLIMETDSAICQKIGQYQAAWQASGFSGTFHQYLLQQYAGGITSVTGSNGIIDTSGNALAGGFACGQLYQIGQQATLTPLSPVTVATHTAEKPQAKAWKYADKWWSVLATSGGTKIFRLDGTTWTEVLTLHSATNSKADCRVVGNLVHILLFRGTSSALLYSVEYDPAIQSYKLWTQRPTSVSQTFETAAETATMTLDGTGRMWIATDDATSVKVRWSDAPYSTWSAPITIATGILDDDICAVTTLPGKIAVAWTNQSTKRFGFKTHTDGAAPSTWSTDEMPASQSALDFKFGMADDHLNLVVASDGTLYCAVKTSYNDPIYPQVALLVRRPAGSWDILYEVTRSSEGTRPIVVLNEALGKVKVVYSSESGGDVQYREAPTSTLTFGAPTTLISSSGNNYSYLTTTHQTYNPDVVILATDESLTPRKVVSVLVTDVVPTPAAPVAVSINRQVPTTEATLASSITYRVAFSEKVTGVDASDFVVTTLSGSAGGTLAAGAVSTVGSDGTTYDVTISSVTGTGVVRLDLKGSGTGIADTGANPLAGGFTCGQAFVIGPQTVPYGFASATSLAQLTVASYSNHKPQGQVWYYAGKWWTVQASPTDTKLFRLDGTSWADVLTIAGSSTNGKADCRVVGDLVHILLYRGTSPAYFFTIEYDPFTQNYRFWSQRPSGVTITLESVAEAAALAADGNGRLWIATDDATSVKVRWSDAPYTTWSAPITIATGILDDDICAITTLPGKIGVLWSNQSTKRFGFRTHTDGTDPATWSTDEVPASQSAQSVGGGMADDHLNMAVAGDGTLYCAVKTSYNTSGYPALALLVRRPAGSWDNLYTVTTGSEGARPFIALNEALGKIKVVYNAENGGDILYREASTVALSFGAPVTLMAGGGNLYNYMSSTHQTYHPEVVVVAANISVTPRQMVSVLATESTSTATTPVVVGINRQTPPTESTAATSVTYRVTFSKPVTGVDAADFVITTVSGNASGVLGAVTPVGAGGTTYDVSIGSVTGTGSLRLDLKGGVTTSGSGGSAPAGYSLDATELEDLLRSCSQCNYMLKENVVLPMIFDPGAGNCLPCDSTQVAMAAFATKFPALDSSDEDYTLLLTNFLNHRFGYSLAYSDYEAFFQRCEDGATTVLCNKAKQQEVETDPVGSCVADLFATALTNAQIRYIAYIDSTRREFRNAYMTKCLNVAPSLKMTADLYEYHYTLYYYDQSGNLVKTVPPEGVALLEGPALDTVRRYRLLQSEGCYQYSDSILLSNNGFIQFLPGAAYSHAPFSAETRVLLTSYSNQVLWSQVQETATSDPQTPLVHTGYVVAVVGSKVQVSLYGYTQDSLYHQQSAVATSVRSVSSLLAQGGWQHLTLVFSGSLSDPWKLYINGNPVALQYATNTLTAGVTLAATTGLVVGANPDPHTGPSDKLQGALKNLRLYNRVLAIGEIRQNAFNNCQLAANPAGVVFWSPLNEATGNQVREVYSDTTGTLTGFTWQPFQGKYPDHRLATTYQYNSLNQVVQQYSPDGDTTYFWYDRLGRLIASQNKEQEKNVSYSAPAGRFSYTRYDELGRIVEVGEKSGASDIRTLDLIDSSQVVGVKAWLASATNRQVTKTIYDEPVNPMQTLGTSRKRVAASVYLENLNDSEGDSTLYSYDISGNVKTLLQHVKALVAADAQNGKKRIDYDYDLVSGKVNKVSYQAGKGDQFFYKYGYDADNRVVRSFSSRDQLLWWEDASYQYFLHGPLARLELGHLKVQGVDYAYTLQGWLKGINAEALDASKEMAKDGHYSSVFSRVARDVYGLKLGYFTGDYQPVGSAGAPAFGSLTYTAPTTLEATGNQLFNGNISYTTLALSKIGAGATAGYSYGYDQLNRLVGMRQHTASGPWSNSNILTAYSESVSYDANGNILKYLRKGAAATLNMDSLSYNYHRDASGYLVNNRLNHVRDSVGSSRYSVDIDNQALNNYTYDRIGNLKTDVKDSITGIDWTVYGKIKNIAKGSTPITYGYDAVGNRTVKEATASGVVTKTFYVRDAQGNVLAVYTKKGTSALQWSEQHLYGSSRLGVWRWDTLVPAAPPVVTGTHLYDSVLVGSRTFELTNHLGNVLATISDKKVGNDSSGMVNFYLAEVLSQTDYYPFGMAMPERKYLAGNGYRYGFNGKELDDHNGVMQYDYGFRIYDPRLGRFKSVDPLSQEYPWNSPYSYAEGDVIRSVDLDGLERYVVTYWYNNSNEVTRTTIKAIREKGTRNLVELNFRKANGNKLTTKDVYIRHLYTDGRFKERVPDRNSLTPDEQRIFNKAKSSSDPRFRIQYDLGDQLGGANIITDPWIPQTHEYRQASERQFTQKGSVLGGVGTTEMIGNEKNGTIHLEYPQAEEFNQLLKDIKKDGGYEHGIVTVQLNASNVTDGQFATFKKGVEHIGEQIKEHLEKAGVKNVSVEIKATRDKTSTENGLKIKVSN